MTLLKAIIRPNKVDDVKDALEKIGAGGITVTEVRGHGKQKGHAAIYRGREYKIDLLPKIEMEVVVADSLKEQAIQAIIAAARTGEVGDGRVYRRLGHKSVATAESLEARRRGVARIRQRASTEWL